MITIIKKNGSKQQFLPNKIYTRIKEQSKGLKIDIDKVYQKVIPGIVDNMTTLQLDEFIAFTIADFIKYHPDYSILASRILITRQGKLINKTPEQVDLNYDFVGTTAFFRGYSVKDSNEAPIELPSMMYDRVANFFGKDSTEAGEFRDELKSKRISVATPILSNGGTARKSYISCNITTNIDDSIEGIEKTLTNAAYGSKEGSGIGLLLDNLRSSESLVSSFNGKAGGVVRYADMLQSKMRFYKQGNRAGSAAIYLSVWHKDIIPFLELKLPTGDEKLRARDLFLAVVINDNFMVALEEEKDWYVFCPNDILKAGLKPFQELWGEEYEQEYNKAVELGLGKKVSPKTIWDAIIKSQAETGVPYVFNKDAANRGNMQDNIGTVASLNLCAEFQGVSKPGYTSQCDLGLLNLAEHDTLESISTSTKVLTRILNRVIDKNGWSDAASKNAGEDQRAIGIGIGGLADFFAKKGLSFTSEEAKEWNKKISETIYKASVEESNKLAKEEGSYPAWKGSKYERGLTYISGWSPEPSGEPIPMRNSILNCYMPSAGTSLLLSVNECFEPFSSNLQVRNIGAGEFVVINKHLVKDLEKMSMWNESVMNNIIMNGGSVQYLDIPDDIKERYRTVWEIPQREVINMTADRQQFIDQSQSMNLYFEEISYAKINSALRYGWKKGLKTGSYYIRSQSKLDNPSRLAGVAKQESAPQKPADSPFSCFGCSS
jgi:ribonucleoside-diphosphate reductase alpha subunit